MTDLDLQWALRALGVRLEAEPQVDLAAAVLARIGVAESRPARSRRSLRTVLVAMAIALLAAVAALGASQSVRDWLGDHGAVLGRSERPVPSITARSLSSLGLGTRVSPEEAERALGRTLPAGARLGTPAAVLLDRTPGGAVVTLVWRPSPGLPAAAVLPSVGALLTIGPPGTGDDAIILAKSLTPSSRAQFVEVPRLGPAVWIAGAPHAVRLVEGRSIGFRLAANALLWSIDARLVRLEGALSRDAAIAVAASVR
jgi:hypothetical protein